jgi:midasin
VLLQAIKEGHWLLIDEMNLAQQSILEGLNAILDHRRTVYIPELNKEFTCHADFFVFACQNPSQSSGSTTGRKTLPKSFLNRFIKIYLDDLTTSDFELILAHIAGDMFASNSDVKKLLRVTQQIQANQSN